MPTSVSSLPSNGPTEGSPTTLTVLSALTTGRISQLGEAPMAGHSVKGGAGAVVAPAGTPGPTTKLAPTAKTEATAAKILKVRRR